MKYTKPTITVANTLAAMVPDTQTQTLIFSAFLTGVSYAIDQSEKAAVKPLERSHTKFDVFIRIDTMKRLFLTGKK